MSSSVARVCLGSPSQERESRSSDVGDTGGRSCGKGRRRRAAAEMRRIEQQRWGANLSEEEAPTPPILTPTTRRARRALRRQARFDGNDEVEEYVYTPPSAPRANIEDLELALALSLSLSDSGPGNMSGMNRGAESSLSNNTIDFSYENLVDLESVRVCTAAHLVDSLSVSVFQGSSLLEVICPICQGEFVEGDSLIFLPCCHSMHNECGREWLLKYSKSCPVCKCEVCEHSE